MTAIHAVVLGLVVLLDVEGRLHEWAESYAARARTRVDVARWLDRELPPAGRYVMGDVGIAGFSTPALAITDAYCLNNAAMGRAAPSDRHRVLRDQVRTAWPDAIVVSSRQATRLRSRSRAFTVLLDDPEIGPRYRLARIFGDDRDEFNYWVYRRRDPIARGRDQ